MAATAGGVAVGSAVGHVAGSALTGMFSGGSSSEAAPAAAAPAAAAAPPPAPLYGQQAQPQEPTGPCAWEIKQFLQCAQGQTDITLCKDLMKHCDNASKLQALPVKAAQCSLESMGHSTCFFHL